MRLFLYRVLLCAGVVSFLILSTNVFAQEKSDDCPTPEALKKATEYWKEHMNNLVKNDENLKKEIGQLAKKREEETKPENEIRPIKEYVAIFTLDWDKNKIKDADKFNNNYKSLKDYKNKITNELNELKDTINKILKKEKVDNKSEDIKVEQNKTDETKTENKKKNEKSTLSTNLLFYLTIGIAITALVFSLLAYIQVKRQKSQKNASYDNIQKIPPQQESENKILQDIQNIQKKLERLENMKKTEENQIEISKQVSIQEKKPSNDSTFYYYGIPSIDQEGINHKNHKLSADEDTCYVIFTKDGKKGTLSLYRDNINTIITFHDKTLMNNLVQKYGWKEYDTNKLSHAEEGEVQLQDDKWIVTKKITLYFNEKKS